MVALSRITTTRLISAMVWRAIWLGFAYGTVMGIVGAFLLMPFTTALVTIAREQLPLSFEPTGNNLPIALVAAMFYGGALGGIVGALMGLLNGAVMAIFTRLYFYPPSHIDHYHRMMRLTAEPLSFFTLLIVPHAFFELSAGDAVLNVLFAGLGAAAARYAVAQLVAWYAGVIVLIPQLRI